MKPFTNCNPVAGPFANRFGGSVASELHPTTIPTVKASADLEQARLDTLRVRRRQVQMSTVIEQAIEVMGPFVAKLDQGLVVTIETGTLEVDADATRLCQVLRHLIANASSFSATATKIRVHAARHLDDVIVVVSDDGAGIEPGRVDTIFAPYLQRHHAGTTRRGGLGIGLHVARAIAAAHDGGLSVASDGSGMGSTFTLRVPCRPADVTASALLHREPSRRSLSNLTAA